MALHYYVQRQYVENGERKTPANYPYATRAEAERQYDLMLAAMWKNEIDMLDPNVTMNVDCESVEIGTIEQGKIKREFLAHVRPEPEPEPEPEEPEEEPTPEPEEP